MHLRIISDIFGSEFTLTGTKWNNGMKPYRFFNYQCYQIKTIFIILPLLQLMCKAHDLTFTSIKLYPHPIVLFHCIWCTYPRYSLAPPVLLFLQVCKEQSFDRHPSYWLEWLSGHLGGRRLPCNMKVTLCINSLPLRFWLLAQKYSDLSIFTTLVACKFLRLTYRDFDSVGLQCCPTTGS